MNEPKKDRWNNRSRKGKKGFQAFLTPVEANLVQRAKDKLKVKTDRQLIIALCKSIEKEE